MIGEGPPVSQPFHQFYDEYDVTSFLRAGENCIAVIVNHFGIMDNARPGLLCELVDADGEMVAGTDAGWRTCPARAWYEQGYEIASNRTARFQLFHDARLMPERWNEAGHDDSAWDAAEVIRGRFSDQPPAAGPWSCLVPRDFPFMAGDVLRPAGIEKVEECIDLASRPRPDDLSLCLSAAGGPLQHATGENVEALLDDDGATTVQCSTQHLNHVFDGIYDPCIVLDFGRVLTAHLELDCEGGAGSVVDIGYAERLIDGQFNNAIEGGFADRYVMREGRQVFRPYIWRAFRYVKLRFRHTAGPVTVHTAGAQVSTYPYEERGDFNSSDEVLNKVFEISRSTLRLCSNESIMDTPWREAAQWLGDVAAVTLPGIYACFGDTVLPGKFLRQAAANQHQTGMLSNVSNMVNHWWTGAIPDYSLWWVMGLWRHYMYSGEQRWVTQFYPQAVRVLHAHLNYLNDDGFLEDMPYWVFIDWADVDKRGECAAYNAIFYGALEALGKMAATIGDARTGGITQALMEKVHAGFQARFYDAGRGCCADARVAGELSAKVSEHANMAALNWGLCDPQTSADIIRRLYEEQSIEYTEAQPFFMVVVLDALARHGRMDIALKLIRERWGGRMVARGATSTYEEWGVNGSWRDGSYSGFMRTLSHAWSACPAMFLVWRLAGFEILAPGCADVAVTPVATPFDYEVTIPTPGGAIRAACRGGATEVTRDGCPAGGGSRR
jgi:hypothetical protein